MTKHRHVWGPNNLLLGCTVQVREAGPVTDPLCKYRGVVACTGRVAGKFGLPMACFEVRCSRHEPGHPRTPGAGK